MFEEKILREVKKEMDVINLFEITAKMVFHKEKNLTTDILNHLRAIPGITVVDILPGETRNVSDSFTSVGLKFKFIPTIPGHGKNLKLFQVFLLQSVKSIKGVSAFSYKSKPQRIA